MKIEQIHKDCEIIYLALIAEKSRAIMSLEDINYINELQAEIVRCMHSLDIMAAIEQIKN